MARTKQTARQSTTTKKSRSIGTGTAATEGKAVASKVEKKERKPHKWRPGTVSIREIKKYQKSTDLLLRKLPFQRLVREVTGSFNPDLRFQATALECLQEACENYLVGLYEDSQLLALHGNRISIQAKDMSLAQRLRHESN